MTEQEYRQAVKELKYEYNAKMRALSRVYITGDAKFRAGDIITDGVNTILVDELRFNTPPLFSTDLPVYYYEGDGLTKRLKRLKSNERKIVYAHNATLIRKKQK